jgi:hypothetical protein
MKKDCLFLALLLTSTLQNVVRIDATLEWSSLDKAPLPVAVPAIRPQINPPTDWAFLDMMSLMVPGGEWVSPAMGRLLPIGHMTEYNIKFTPACNQNDVELRFSATGSAFVYINDKFLQSWSLPYPKTHMITIDSKDLKCGCNNVKIMVYNYYFESPAALIYTLQQDNECSCQNEELTFYNKDTCQCECINEYECKNPLKKWHGYPTCGCKCSNIKECAAEAEFNRKSC